jgi:RNA-binding protein 23/39
MESRCVLLKNMFSPEEYVLLSHLTVYFIQLFDRETDADWDKELAEDVKGECETKYGPVDRIKVEKESQVKSMLNP